MGIGDICSRGGMRGDYSTLEVRPEIRALEAECPLFPKWETLGTLTQLKLSHVTPSIKISRPLHCIHITPSVQQTSCVGRASSSPSRSQSFPLPPSTCFHVPEIRNYDISDVPTYCPSASHLCAWVQTISGIIIDLFFNTALLGVT